MFCIQVGTVPLHFRGASSLWHSLRTPPPEDVRPTRAGTARPFSVIAHQLYQYTVPLRK